MTVTSDNPTVVPETQLRPTVTVVMANYNGAAHVAEAIASVRQQSLSELELIVSDDGSTDDSVGIVTRLMAEDSRIRLIRSVCNTGPGAARNRALAMARGGWIAVMDSDDLMRRDRLTMLVDAAQRDGADIVADDVIEFASGEDPSLGRALVAPSATSSFWVDVAQYIRCNDLYGPGPTLGYLKPLFRASVLTGSMQYDESLTIGEDFDLVLRLLYAGRRFRIHPEALYYYRKHATSLSHRLNERALEALAVANIRLLEQIPKTDQRLLALVRRRQRSIETALAYEALLTTLKSRRWWSSVRIALTRPRAVALLRLPLGVRLRRLILR